MTRLTDMMIFTHWTAFGDFTGINPQGGMGFLIDPTTIFDDACDIYADFRGKNPDSNARVFQLDFAGGNLLDVTDEANWRIAQWLTDSRRDLPEWLEADSSERAS